MKIILTLLLFGATCFSQAVPQHTYVVGGCNATAQDAVHFFEVSGIAPRFDLYIICNAADWGKLAQKNDFKATSFSFTVLHKGMIWLGPKAISSPSQMRESVRHELEHLRCDCDLGEDHS